VSTRISRTAAVNGVVVWRPPGQRTVKPVGALGELSTEVKLFCDQ
jgi:hypothetical protein